MPNNKQVNDHNISGKIIHVGQPESFVTKAGNTIISRLLVMEVFHGPLREEVAFEFKQDVMNQLLQIKEGQWCTVQFALRGYKTIKDGKARWWNRLEGLSIMKG